MFVEALNTGHDELFGPAVRELVGHARRTVPEEASPDSSSVDAEKGLTGGGDSGRRQVKFRWM